MLLSLLLPHPLSLLLTLKEPAGAAGQVPSPDVDLGEDDAYDSQPEPASDELNELEQR